MSKTYTKPNWSVVVNDPGYTDGIPGTTSTLAGIYPTKPEAVFIANKIYKRYKLPQFPVISITSEECTCTIVGDFLEKTKKTA